MSSHSSDGESTGSASAGITREREPWTARLGFSGLASATGIVKQDTKTANTTGKTEVWRLPGFPTRPAQGLSMARDAVLSVYNRDEPGRSKTQVERAEARRSREFLCALKGRPAASYGASSR